MPYQCVDLAFAVGIRTRADYTSCSSHTKIQANVSLELHLYSLLDTCPLSMSYPLTSTSGSSLQSTERIAQDPMDGESQRQRYALPSCTLIELRVTMAHEQQSTYCIDPHPR